MLKIGLLAFLQSSTQHRQGPSFPAQYSWPWPASWFIRLVSREMTMVTNVVRLKGKVEERHDCLVSGLYPAYKSTVKVVSQCR